MRPYQFNAKKEINHNEMYTSHLPNINRDSHFIRKTFPSSSSSSSLPSPCASSPSSVSISAPTLATKSPPPQPLIIFTQPPKIIHTNPDDFMELVQRLTGLSQADRNPNPSPKKEPSKGVHGANNVVNKVFSKAAISGESESSGVTEDSCLSPNTILDDPHVNSYFPTTPIFDPNNYCFDNIPMFMPNDYMCSSQPFFNNYTDPLLLMPGRMRNTISPSTNLDGFKELHDF